VSQKHVYYERDWSTGQLWRIERGHFGTKFRVLVRGVPEKNRSDLANLIRKIEAEAKANEPKP